MSALMPLPAIAGGHKILFWNAAGKDQGDVLARLCLAHDIDTVILAEAWSSVGSLSTKLSAPGIGGYLDASGGSQRLRIFSRLPYQSIVPKADHSRATIKEITPQLGAPFLLVAVHLPSKLHYEADDQTLHTRVIVDLIRDAERTVGHSRTLVIGDFNMDPFETGMAAAGAFHAVMDRNVARRETRTINGLDYPFFYNPMWSRMGDALGRPAGTFRRSGSAYLEYFWRTFDQVLLSPALLDRVPDGSVEIINRDGTGEFVDAEGRWHAPSDHLPIVVTIS